MKTFEYLLTALFLSVFSLAAEEIQIKQFELNDGKKIQAQRYMMVKDGEKTLYQAKLLNGKTMVIKGEDVKEVTDVAVSDDSIDSKTANRLKDESDNSQRTQIQRTLAAEKDKKITDEHTDMMREFINTQNELKKKKDEHAAKLAIYNAAKQQIPISKAEIINADSEYRAGSIYLASALSVSEVNAAKQRMLAAEAKRSQHTILLAQAKDAVAQLELPLQALDSDIRTTERLVVEQKNAMQELKESRKSQPVSNPLR